MMVSPAGVHAVVVVGAAAAGCRFMMVGVSFDGFATVHQ